MSELASFSESSRQSGSTWKDFLRLVFLYQAPYNSNIVAREPISSIEGLLRSSSSAFAGRGMIDDFQHVSVTCRDPERSIHFYERLGLKVIQGLWDTVDLFRPGQIDNTMPWTGESCVRRWYWLRPRRGPPHVPQLHQSCVRTDLSTVLH